MSGQQGRVVIDMAMNGRPSRRRIKRTEVHAANQDTSKTSAGCWCKMGIFAFVVVVLVSTAAVVTVLVVGSQSPAGQRLQDVEGNATETSNVDILLKGIEKSPSIVLADDLPGGVNAMNRPWYNLRLPKNTRPLHYELYVDVNMKRDKFECDTTIWMETVGPTRYIVLHSSNLIVKDVEVLSIGGQRRLPIKQYFLYPANHYLVIIMRQTLSPGQYAVRIRVRGTINYGLTGVYKSYYTMPNGTKRKVISTLFAPVDARKQMPCFDEPHLKANFTVTLRYNNGYRSMSNMGLRRQIITSTHTTDYYETSIKMSTYLLSYVICDYVYNEIITPKNVSIRVWAPAYIVRNTKYALHAANKTLAYYEQLFAIDFPLKKIDMIGLPNFAVAAMEHWGLITFRASRLLYDDVTSAPEQRKRVAAIIAHELAHQWFGNLVTMEWWNDVWLNEGSASFLEYIGTDNMEADFNIYQLFLLENLYPVFKIDSTYSARTLSKQVSSTDDINRMFDTITYNKGACLLFMVQSFLGKEVMFEGLRSYLRHHEYGSANQKDLWRALSAESGVNIEKMMRSWTLQKGYPLVNINRTQDGKLEISQYRYTTRSLTITDDTTWIIPLTFQISGRLAPHKYLLHGNSSIVIPFPNCSWYKANIKQHGYYRVNYDEDNWSALTNELQNNHLAVSVRDRSNLLDDALELAKSGHLDYLTFLNASQYLTKEEDYVPWRVAIDGFYGIKQHLSLGTSKMLDKYFWHLIRAVSKKFGMTTIDHLCDGFLQVAALGVACDLKDPHTTRSVHRLLRLWMAGNVTIPRQMRSMVYFHGIRNGNNDDWNYLYRRYQNSRTMSERSEILLALGASENPRILMRYLNDSLDLTKIGLQDTAGALLAVARGSPTGRQITWQFIKSKWKQLTDLFGHGVFLLYQVMERVLNDFNTAADLQSVRLFMDKHTDSPRALSVLQQAMQAISRNIMWRRLHDRTIRTWLERHQLNWTTR